jgi:3-keto-5-aminohexanoate cleavage enzyme
MLRDAVLLEVGLNEAVRPDAHARVPQSPVECAADARRCADAGAALVHWHAVGPDGIARLGDTELYAAALEAMAGCVLAYPSYPTDVPDTVGDRLGHCLALRERHGMEVAPVDVATVNLVLWDEASATVGPTESLGALDVIRNSMPFVTAALRRYREVGLVPTLAAFDVGSTRAIAALARAGLVPEPVLLKIFLWGAPAIGPEPSVEALDLHLRQLPASIDVEWILVSYNIADRGLVEALARAALERGGGIRLGIGDNPVAFADLDNAGVVDLGAGWAQDAGRAIASVADARVRLGTSVPPLRSEH